jgi:cystathionine gamma-lyase
MGLGTKVIRAGLPTAEQGRAFLHGVCFAAPYHASGEPSSSPYAYGRYHDPTWTQFERALGDLQSGVALSFASGMAVVAAVFCVTLRPGDVIVMPSDSYYTARLLADGFFTEVGGSSAKSADRR